MTSVRRGTPRLFTGALLPEEVSNGLMAIAARHKLESNVWVPKRLVKVLREGATLLPNAVLCDILLIPGCGACDLDTLGGDRLLVNAVHTSHKMFFEKYRDDVAAGVHGAFPLTHGGVPYGTNRRDGLSLLAKKKGFKVPYWVKERNCSKARILNAEETPYQGRYNPVDCVMYEPHTLTNQSFPAPIAVLMRRKASRFGYVSRTWLTAEEGALFGTRLNCEKMKNGPPIFTSHFSGCGGVHAVEYFCADQFEAAGVFPTGREISLAAGGVLIDKEKASGFPVLSSLFEEPSTIARHQRMSEEVARVSAPILFNLSNQTVFPCPDGTALDIIRRFTLLKGYTKPYFVRHTRDFAEVCPLKPKEQGLVLNSSRAYGMGLDSRLGECVFNVEQFEEPQCVEELIVKTPTNFPNQSPFRGVRCALACARAQRAKSGFSHLWIPATFLSYLDGKWPLLPGATRVEWGMYLSTLMPALYNVSDVEVPPNALEWWPTYVPHDALHRPLTGAARGVVSLRAWERGYKSPMWMTHVMMTRFGAKLKPVGRKRSYLRGDPFGESRGVVIGNRKYFNIEEVENVDQFLTNLRNTGTSN